MVHAQLPVLVDHTMDPSDMIPEELLRFINGNADQHSAHGVTDITICKVTAISPMISQKIWDLKISAGHTLLGPPAESMLKLFVNPA